MNKLKKQRRIIFISFLITLLLTLYLIINLANYMFHQTFTVVGNSMQPTLEPNQKIKVDSAYYTKNELKKGNIIAIKFKTKEKLNVKRIIALPEDKIIFGKDSNIYINDKKLNEPYLTQDNVHFNPKYMVLLLKQLEFYNNTIPKGYVLVMGDNRQVSIDSGNYGIIPIEYIIGKVII